MGHFSINTLACSRASLRRGSRVLPGGGLPLPVYSILCASHVPGLRDILMDVFNNPVGY
jgi:hypothetical protein